MTAMSIWRPFREATSLQEQVNQIFRDVFSEMDSLEQSLLTPMSLAPKTDIYEEDDKVHLEMEVLGLREEDINLTIEGNTLTISGKREQTEERRKGRYQRVERHYDSFSRAFNCLQQSTRTVSRRAMSTVCCISPCRRRQKRVRVKSRSTGR